MGEDFSDIAELGTRLCHKVMVDAQAKTFGNMEVVVLHQVVYCADRTVGTVFDRENTVLAETLFHSIEYTFEAVEKHYARHFKEFLACSLRVGSCDTLAGNYSFFREKCRCFGEGFVDSFCQIRASCQIIVLAGSAGIKNSIEEKPCISVIRFADLFRYLVKDLLLASVTENCNVVLLFILRYFKGFFHTSPEQVGKLCIDLVYIVSEFIKCYFSHCLPPSYNQEFQWQEPLQR